jgi:hypothetical protein
MMFSTISGNVIYSRRRNALSGDQLQNDIFDMLEDLVENMVTTYFPEGAFEELRDEVLRHLAVDIELDRDKWALLGEDGLIDHIIEKHLKRIAERNGWLPNPFTGLSRKSRNRIPKETEQDTGDIYGWYPADESDCGCGKGSEKRRKGSCQGT